MKKKQDNLTLGEGNINRLMFRFSIPCIMSLLISYFVYHVYPLTSHGKQ